MVKLSTKSQLIREPQKEREKQKNNKQTKQRIECR